MSVINDIKKQVKQLFSVPKKQKVRLSVENDRVMILNSITFITMFIFIFFGIKNMIYGIADFSRFDSATKRFMLILGFIQMIFLMVTLAMIL
jgi:hypothetical protein